MNLSLFQDRRAWLEARHGIGSSDAPAITGHSPWNSPYALWCEKRGVVQGDSLPDEERAERLQAGIFLEPAIANWYASRTERPVVTIAEYLGRAGELAPFAIVKHPVHDFMLASPDRIIPGAPDKDGPGVLEIKNTDSWNESEWRDDQVPLYYQIQVQHQLAVLDLQWGAIAVCIGGQKLVHRDVVRHEGFIAGLIEAERAFWRSVLAGQEPDLDSAEATYQAVRARWLEEDQAAAPVEIDADLAIDLAQASADLSNAEQRSKFAKARLMAVMGNSTAATYRGVKIYSWKKTAQAVMHKVGTIEKRKLFPLPALAKVLGAEIAELRGLDA